MPDKKLVSGIVKEIDDVVVTVTIKEPGRGKAYKVDVNRRTLQNGPLKKGDSVTIDLSEHSIEATIPLGASMLDIEEAIADALGLVKANLPSGGTPQKKTSAKRSKKA